MLICIVAQIAWILRLFTSDINNMFGYFIDMKRCLELNYFMYGYGCGKLKVKANEKTVFSVSRSQENQWLTTFIEMPIPLHNVNTFHLRE